MAVRCPECHSIVTSRDGYCPVCDSALEPMKRPFNWHRLGLAGLILAAILAIWLGFAYLHNKAERFYQKNIIERAVGKDDQEFFGK